MEDKTYLDGLKRAVEITSKVAQRIRAANQYRGKLTQMGSHSAHIADMCSNLIQEEIDAEEAE
jgi:hypothetical protein